MISEKQDGVEIGLNTKLTEAFESSPLPEGPTTVRALNDFVVRTRVELGRDDG